MGVHSLKILKIIWRLLSRTLLGLVVLTIVLLIFSRIEKRPLPNGLEVGRRFIWEGYNDFYLWTADGDLIVPYAVDLMCFNDKFIRGNAFYPGNPAFIYDIENREVTYSDDPEYLPRRRQSNLSQPSGGCNGYTTYLAGSNMAHVFPGYFADCTLATPCTFEALPRW